MASALRFVGSNSCSNKLRLGGILCLRPLSAATSTQSPATNQEFFEKNKRLNRPMSPHLTIYKPQVTTMLSITHRMTGMYLAGATYAFAAAAIALPGTFPHHLEALTQLHLGSSCIFAAKFLLAFPLAFHFFNGLRHLAWDMGYGFQIKTLYQTGYAVLVLSLLAGAWLASL